MKELVIEHIPPQGRRGARVRVSYRPEPAAQATSREAPFKFELSAEQRRAIQWYLEEYLLYPWGEFRTRAAGVEQMMVEVGEALFRAVFCNEEMRALYSRIANDLDKSRITIHAADAAGIALPWELLRDPTKAEYGELARLAYAFTRSQPDLVFDPAPPPAGDTFNILMVISRPGGPEGDVPFQSVARPLLELFRPHRDRVHLDVLRPSTFERLGQVLAEKPGYYHVVHFDGHGAFPSELYDAAAASQFYGEPGAQGLLAFEGEDGKSRLVTGEELGKVLARSRVPVVLLNACQSGMTHPESLYPSVGNQLLKAGARGVIAMTYSVYVQSAVRFMAHLYEALINGEELDRATWFAREDLCTHPQRSSVIGDVPLRDWIVPVLFQAAPVRVAQRAAPLRLDLDLLADAQAEAGAEVGCPEPPAFGFVGRDGVILELERAFGDETVVLLQGMAGVGKTEAAMGFARWRVETGGLGGPIFFSRFEHYLPLSQVVDRVGQTFAADIKQQLGAEWHLLDAEQRRQLAVAILRQVPCLLIWDNFEPVAGFPAGTASDWQPAEQQELAAFLRDLRGGATKVLITSRRDEPWLGPVYRPVQLRGLNLAEAQELAVRVLRRAGLDAVQLSALPEYNHLLIYLQGNPLAIQVILPELKRRRPDALLADLQAGSATLAADDRSQGRERSLAASLSYRLGRQDAALRGRLGVLALFQGFVDADVLEWLCSVEGAPSAIADRGRDAWIADLDRAAQLGLLRALGSGYYSVHPALPWYFHDLMADAFAGQQAWLERSFASLYGEYGVYLLEMFSYNAQLAMQLLSAEEGNLRHSLCLARCHGQNDAVEGTIYGLKRLLEVQGRWAEWTRLIGDLEVDSTGSDGAPLPGQEDLWRALLGHRAEIALQRHDWMGAVAPLLQLREHFEITGDDRNLASALHQLGMIAQERRQWDEAEHWYRQSLSVGQRTEDEQGQAETLNNLGIIAQERRQWDEAERWCQQSLVIKERIGDEHGRASTLHLLGMIAQERRQWDEAERWFLQSLVIKERIGDEHGQAATLHQLGMIAQERWQWDEAERRYRQSLAIEERVGAEHEQAHILGQLGNLAQARRQWDEAERWYKQSLTIDERIEDVHGQAKTLHNLGMLAQERRQFDEAERWYRQSLAIKEGIRDEYGQALTLGQLALLAEERGYIADARALYQCSAVIFERVNAPFYLEMTRDSLRRIDAQQG